MAVDRQMYKDTLKKAHLKALDKAKAKMPATDATEIIKTLVRLFESEDRKGEVDKLLSKYGEAALVYAKVVSDDFIRKAIQDTLQNAEREEFKKLAEG